MNTNPEDMYKSKREMSSICLISHTTLGSTPPSQRLVPACHGIVSREVQAHQCCHVELEIQKGILYLATKTTLASSRPERKDASELKFTWPCIGSFQVTDDTRIDLLFWPIPVVGHIRQNTFLNFSLVQEIFL